MPAESPARGRAIAFAYQPPSYGFIANERACLEEIGEVTPLEYRGMGPRHIVDSWRAARHCDALYGFFASEHMLVPTILFRLLRKRVVVVLGGYDVANVAAHRYGLAATGKGWLPRLLIRLSDVVLPVSHATAVDAAALTAASRAKATVVHNAVDPERFPDPRVARDPGQVLTLALMSEESFSRKGVDRFIALAAADPDRSYVLAGRVDPGVRDRLAALPPNLTLAEDLDDHALARLLWSSQVYAQLSWYESFGVSLAEAMLCGCAPVISDVRALAEVAGPWAVRSADARGDVDAISRAASASIDRGLMRADVADRFSRRRRRDAIERALYP